MESKSLLTLVLATFALSGCVEDSESVTPEAVPGTAAGGFVARYVPLAGIVPFPNDLFFNGSVDGTVNIPVADEADLGDPLVAINHLDGFSTTAAIHVRFTDALNEATLLGGVNVHVFEVDVDPATTATVGFRSVLVPDVDYSISVAASSDTNGAVMEINPLRPLDAGFNIGTGLNIGYLVLVTNGVRSAGGSAAGADDSYAAILSFLGGGGSTGNATLDQIAQLVGAHHAIGTAVLGDTSNVIMSFSFTTQDATVVMETVEAISVAGTPSLIGPTGLNNADVLDPTGALGLVGLSDIHVGTITIPYYSSITDPINGYWTDSGGDDLTRYNPIPSSNGNVTIPVLALVPNATAASAFGCAKGAGWPVVIFQHGITQDRSNLLALGEALGQACTVGIAIDHPLHGITDPTNPLYAGSLERHFGLDLDGEAGIDSSGAYFLNPLALLTTRDNFRQTAADLIALSKTIGTIDLDGGGADLDTADVHFAGHSLGAILGTIYLGVNTDATAATLANGGVSWATMLVDSESIGATVIAGLAENGIFPGTQFFLEFLRNAQTALDAGDPYNYAAQAAVNHPIHLFQVADDAVVPNSATAIMANAMGLTTADTGTMTDVSGVGAGPYTLIDAAGVRGFVRFSEGSHSSFLNPATSLAATTEMQTQFAVFIAGFPGLALPDNGWTLLVQDQTVVDLAP
jgi:pimeloyl-ACP methyl ester carboxylesterase